MVSVCDEKEQVDETDCVNSEELYNQESIVIQYKVNKKDNKGIQKVSWAFYNQQE